MEVHDSSSLFPPEENQEEAEIWAKFMAMGQANGLEWARKMVAAQGAQQQLENPGAANTNEVQPSDSGLCLLSGESVVAPAKRKRPARATAGNKIKEAKKDSADSNLAEGPATSQKDSGTRRTKKDILEQEVAGASGVPRTAGGHATGATMRIEQEQTGQPAKNVSCGPVPGASVQGLQVGLGKMMEAMNSFMVSAKVLAGLGMDDQGSSSRRACAGQVWGQGSNSPPKGQGEVPVHGVEGSVGPATDTLAEGADITVPTKEVEKHKWKRKVKPEESIDNWLETFTMLHTVIMERFREQEPALCKYNRVIYEEYTRNRGTGWLNYDREFRQKMEQAPEMAWDCREIELWVQYMGNDSRPATSDPRFAIHKQARPYYFKQQLRPSFRGKPPQRGRVVHQYRFNNNSCRLYNGGTCSWGPICKFTHNCSKCAGWHPAAKCSKVSKTDKPMATYAGTKQP
ncbi:hypothetical protein NDU88_002778 [Pleurodeles waltl]|uniref:C3H1-type domain-containing protein n=1 Tax=Pleurodeles waltl TaxID=8319 RepID=A0AAV7M2M9_PLEWA|nr:hypothetical protein NDU88_002778 [Pleurodeles waltl]